MISLHLAATIAITKCRSCGAQMPASDNFCRRCGNSQTTAPITEAKGLSRPDYETTLLRNDTGSYQSLSGLMINALTENVGVRTAPLCGYQLGVRIIAVVITIPIWLLIILLSPIDAYTAARAASSQINYQ